MSISEVENQRQVAIVDGNAGDVDDARDTLLYSVRELSRNRRHWLNHTLDSSERENIVISDT